MRVMTRDVGGNCPVKWTSEREAFLADYHGRDLAVRAELVLN